MGIRRLFRLLYAAFATLGAGVLVAVVLCFTSVPWQLYKWFSTDTVRLDREPDYVVILGGGGVPSESGLVRTYHGAAMARLFTNAWVMVSLPSDGDISVSEVGKMRQELILRGVEASRIVLEDVGRNTRAQAQSVQKILGPDAPERRILLVTSPDHMKRALLTFRKLGFAHISASAAFPESVKIDMTIDRRALGGKESYLPDIGHNLTLRYLFWSNVNYLGTVFRETFALGYYRMMGWI